VWVVLSTPLQFLGSSYREVITCMVPLTLVFQYTVGDEPPCGRSPTRISWSVPMLFLPLATAGYLYSGGMCMRGTVPRPPLSRFRLFGRRLAALMSASFSCLAFYRPRPSFSLLNMTRSLSSDRFGDAAALNRQWFFLSSPPTLCFSRSSPAQRFSYTRVFTSPLLVFLPLLCDSSALLPCSSFREFSFPSYL